MIRRLFPLLTGTVLLLTGMVLAADEPGPDQPDAPLRLKKKKKPDMAEPAKPDPAKPPMDEDKKPGEKKEDKKMEDMPGEITKDGEPIDPDEDDKEVLERVAKNMKAFEDRLANKELNDGTRQIGEDIVKDLDSLIKSSEGGGGGEDNANNEQQNGGEGKQGDKQQQQKGPSGQSGKQGGKGTKSQSGSKQGNKQQQQPGQQKRSGKQGSSPQQQPGGQGTKPGGAQEKGGMEKGGQPMGKNGETNQGNPGQNPNPNADPKSKDNFGEPNKDAEIYKDAWGHLPEALRAQMNAYSSREKYMDKHQDLIKQYYKTIAAQGRKKGE